MPRIVCNICIAQQIRFYLFARRDTAATACFVAVFVQYFQSEVYFSRKNGFVVFSLVRRYIQINATRQHHTSSRNHTQVDMFLYTERIYHIFYIERF